MLEQHGRVDILVNNAGRSIRRSVEHSYDRFHDFERTMQLNYFGALRLILSLLPSMRKRSKGRKGGHIINISSIGVQTNTPRFSAYVASKAALDAWSRCVASEVVDDGVHITTIHMPLVRTPMIAPTKMYDAFPTITPDEAAEMITAAMITKPKKVATRLGNFGELLYNVAPKASDAILNTAYKLFPESSAAKGEGRRQAGREGEGALDRGRRLRVPDARRSLVAMGAATRRLKHWGWGYEDQQPSARPDRGHRQRPSRSGSGSRSTRSRSPFRSTPSSCRESRLAPPPELAEMFSASATTGSRTRSARPTATSCAASGASSRTRPTWSPTRSRAEDVDAILSLLCRRGRGRDSVRGRHQRGAAGSSRGCGRTTPPW